MSKSNYLENRVLDAVFNNTALAIAMPYVALHTADPGENGTNAEVTGTNGVARVSASFGPALNGSLANDADVTFAAATGNLGTITHVSIWDAGTGGNPLWAGPLTTPQAVPTGVSFRLPTGQLIVSDD